MALLALLALALLPRAPEPSTFVSPSGEWSLAVSRPENDWNGANDLVMARAGAEVWRARLALGLREAFVSDEGRVGGFGYSGKPGPEGSPRPDGARGEVLRVFALDPSGVLVLDESHPRGPSLHLDSTGNPVATGAFHHAELGRLVVRIADEDLTRGAEEWWAYELASGAVLFRERPRSRLGLDATLHAVLGARPVPGTPLVLVTWTRIASADGRRAHGLDFQLVDPEWTLVWSHELRYEPRPGQDRLQMGGQAATVAQRSFEILVAPGGKRGRFEVRPDGRGWSVTEVAQK